MTVENGDERAGRNPAWTWVAAGIAVLLGHALLVAVGAIDPEKGQLIVVAAVLVFIGLVRGVMDWRNRRGR